MVVTFKEENTAAFKHLFLKGYQDHVPQAVHTQAELNAHIQFAVQQVGSVDESSVPPRTSQGNKPFIIYFVGNNYKCISWFVQVVIMLWLLLEESDRS